MTDALRYEAVPARRLDPKLITAWREMLPPDGDLSSPFFHPAYALAAAEVLEGVEVCVISARGAPVGFYAYQRIDGANGRPIGGKMSNFQGVIARDATAWQPAQLLRGCGLRALGFHHQVLAQREFEPYVERTVSSPTIALAGGWPAFLDARREAGVSSFNALPRKMRKIERELGPIHFEAQVDDAAVLDRLVEWKRAQYERTGARGSLLHASSVDVLRSLLRRQGADFAGTLSALYAGPRLIAAHVGMRTTRTWHYWFPAYDPSVGALSPGLVLMYEMCRWAADAGLHRIDLGPGEGAHKDLFATGETSVAVGHVVRPPRSALIARLVDRLRHRRVQRP